MWSPSLGSVSNCSTPIFASSAPHVVMGKYHLRNEVATGFISGASISVGTLITRQRQTQTPDPQGLDVEAEAENAAPA